MTLQLKMSLSGRSCSHRPEGLVSYEYCKERCTYIHPLCKHDCRKPCYEDCGLCEMKVVKLNPVCGHPVRIKCHIPITKPCNRLVPSFEPSTCGHPVAVPCHQSKRLTSDEVMNFCTQKCPGVLSDNGCGHGCGGSCGECYQGEFHIRCRQPCERMLVCGHRCKVPCSVVCPPCLQKCMVSCEHHQCPYACGVPCDYVCSAPCQYGCEHSRCTKRCGEACNREGCNERCSVILDCGHPCQGFCGEDCPPCRHCNPEAVVDFLGLLEEGGDNDDIRLVNIPNCEHTVDSHSLLQWIKSVDGEGEIKLRTCPVCLDPLPLNFRRYSKYIYESWKQIVEVKTKIVGNREEMSEQLMALKMKTNNLLKKPGTTFKGVGCLILKECRASYMAPNRSHIKFDSMNTRMVGFLEWMFNQWEQLEEMLSICREQWEDTYYKRIENACCAILRRATKRFWPLHPNEMISFIIETRRIRDLKLLYDRVSRNMEDRVRRITQNIEGQTVFADAEQLLSKVGAYTKEIQKQFEQKFQRLLTIQRCTLNITEDERNEIVKAFGSGAGRWFKCPNGHVYVVTECGGVTETGKCSECGEIIGGVTHMVLSTNTLATEMDGARIPLYPTALMGRD